MDVTIRGHNVDVTQRLQEYVEKKVGKLDRYLPTISEARMELAEVLPEGRMRVRALRPDAASYSPRPGDLAVDLSGAQRPGPYAADVRATVPEGLLVEYFEPRTVDVLLRASAAPDQEAGR